MRKSVSPTVSFKCDHLNPRFLSQLLEQPVLENGGFRELIRPSRS
jgi:hypothetical protein